MIELHNMVAKYSLQDGAERTIEFSSTFLEEAEIDAYIAIIEKHNLVVRKHHNPGVPYADNDANNIKIIEIKES